MARTAKRVFRNKHQSEPELTSVIQISDYKRHLNDATEWLVRKKSLDVSYLQCALHSVNNTIPGEFSRSSSVNSPASCVITEVDTAESLSSNSFFPDSHYCRKSGDMQARLKWQSERNNRRCSAPSAMIFKNRGRSLSMHNLIPDTMLHSSHIDNSQDQVISGPGNETRRLLYEGPVKISKNRASSKQRYLFVCSDVLLLGKQKSDPSSSVNKIFTMKTKLTVLEVWLGERPCLSPDSTSSSGNLAVESRAANSFVIGWPPVDNWTFTFPSATEATLARQKIELAIHHERASFADARLTAKVVNQTCKDNKAQSSKCLRIPVNATVTELKQTALRLWELEERCNDIDICLGTDESSSSHNHNLKLRGFENPFSIIYRLTCDRHAASNTASPSYFPGNLPMKDQLRVNFILRARKSSSIDSVTDDVNQGSGRTPKIGSGSGGNRNKFNLFRRQKAAGDSENKYNPGGKVGKCRVFGNTLSTVWPDGCLPDSIVSLFALVHKYREITKGVFRVSPIQSQLDLMTNKVDQCDEAIKDDGGINVKIAAAVIKRFLRDIPEGLLNYDFSEEWSNISNCSDEEEKIRRSLECLSRLPPMHKHVVNLLIVTLCEVANAEEYNLMTPNALSIVISPNVGLQPPGTNLPVDTHLLEWMIERADRLVTSEERSAIFDEFRKVSPSGDGRHIDISRSAEELTGTTPDSPVSLVKTPLETSNDSGLHLSDQVSRESEESPPPKAPPRQKRRVSMESKQVNDNEPLNIVTDWYDQSSENRTGNDNESSIIPLGSSACTQSADPTAKTSNSSDRRSQQPLRLTREFSERLPSSVIAATPSPKQTPPTSQSSSHTPQILRQQRYGRRDGITSTIINSSELLDSPESGTSGSSFNLLPSPFQPTSTPKTERAAVATPSSETHSTNSSYLRPMRSPENTSTTDSETDSPRSQIRRVKPILKGAERPVSYYATSPSSNATLSATDDGHMFAVARCSPFSTSATVNSSVITTSTTTKATPITRVQDVKKDSSTMDEKNSFLYPARRHSHHASKHKVNSMKTNNTSTSDVEDGASSSSNNNHAVRREETIQQQRESRSSEKRKMQHLAARSRSQNPPELRRTHQPPPQINIRTDARVSSLKAQFEGSGSSFNRETNPINRAPLTRLKTEGGIIQGSRAVGTVVPRVRELQQTYEPPISGTADQSSSSATSLTSASSSTASSCSAHSSVFLHPTCSTSRVEHRPSRTSPTSRTRLPRQLEKKLNSETESYV